MKQIGSDKIVWSDSTIEDLRRQIVIPEIEDYEDQDDDEQEFEEIVDDSEYIQTDESVAANSDPVFTVTPPLTIDIDFPWPISVKSSTFVTAGGKTTGVDTVLTWEDILIADDYEVRITGL